MRVRDPASLPAQVYREVQQNVGVTPHLLLICIVEGCTYLLTGSHDFLEQRHFQTTPEGDQDVLRTHPIRRVRQTMRVCELSSQFQVLCEKVHLSDEVENTETTPFFH